MPELPPNMRPDAFAGLADDYVRYRLPYPQPLLDEVLAEARLPARPRLLDLACGPGRVALPIAHRFAEVWAIDQEPDMIAAGRREAARIGVSNVRWLIGRAEDLEAPAGGFDLVTIGEAFHRLDRPHVARLAFAWLKPGGALATLGLGGPHDQAAPWRPIVADVVRSFIGEPARRLGAPNATLAEEIADQEDDIRRAGFIDIATRSMTMPHVWTLETLLGNARSVSTLSPRALGDRHAAFEAALSEALLAYDPSGRYSESIDCGYTTARRPVGRPA
jgi:ubiquinone/menaquinone biosynthesis C-methylase UbiE